MSEITQEQVEHIARLARLRMGEREKKAMAKDMGSILTFIEKLNEVDTIGVEPTAQVTGLEDVFRRDQAGQWFEGNPFDLVEAAPQQEERFVKVKGVFNGTD